MNRRASFFNFLTVLESLLTAVAIHTRVKTEKNEKRRYHAVRGEQI